MMNAFIRAAALNPYWNVPADLAAERIAPNVVKQGIGYLTTMTLYDFSRSLWVGVWYRRVRPLDHGVKMIGFYFAMLSAGAGNLLEQFQPISQVLPSAIGMVAMIGFVVWYSLNPIGRRRLETA